MDCPRANSGWEPRGVSPPGGGEHDREILLEAVLVQVREVKLDVGVWPCLPSRLCTLGALEKGGCWGSWWVGGVVLGWLRSCAALALRRDLPRGCAGALDLNLILKLVPNFMCAL